MSKGKVILGVLAGVAVGALLGVLFAPDKGSETRKKILRKGNDSLDGLKGKLDELIEDLNERCEAMKEDANDLYAKGKSKAEEIEKEIEKEIKTHLS